jgi:lipopolysaccharide/colanic/teichoic acid biosynthesis glycosyltransferase
MDLTLALAGLAVLAPVLGVIAVLIVRASPGPVLYRAQRIGRGGRPFFLLKFRTMIVDADRQGPGLTLAGDARITSIGRWLRRTKLDELPQLFNVLKGEMSLVGPRPEDPRYVDYYTPEQRQLFTVAPGITSLASLRYRAEEHLLTGPNWEGIYLTQILPHKLEIELEYLRTRNLLTDFGIILRTALALIY